MVISYKLYNLILLVIVHDSTKFSLITPVQTHRELSPNNHLGIGATIHLIKLGLSGNEVIRSTVKSSQSQRSYQKYCEEIESNHSIFIGPSCKVKSAVRIDMETYRPQRYWNWQIHLLDGDFKAKIKEMERSGRMNY